MSLQKLIDFGIIPIDSIQVSSNADGNEAVKMFDGRLNTSWKPAVSQPNSFTQVNFLSPHLVKAFDIAFVAGDKRKYTFRVEAMDGDNPNRWIRVNTYESRGTTLEPIRVNIPDVLTKAIRITYLSYNEAGHMGTVPEVAELRIYGQIEEGEAPGNVKIPELGCPEGYALDVSIGKCMKDVRFEYIIPTDVTGESKQDPGGVDNLEGNVVDESDTSYYTMKGKDSKFTLKWKVPQKINAIFISIINDQRNEYNLTVNIPNKVQIPVTIQKELKSSSMLLDETVTSDIVELILSGTTQAEEIIQLARFDILGEAVLEDDDGPPTGGETRLDAQGVRMIYAPKVGGQVVTAKNTNQKESKHNTGTRTSLYSNKPYSANSGELTEGFIMNLSDNGEQNAPKLYSGGHTGSGKSAETQQGQCYAVGVNQNGSLHLAKEVPYHNITPKAYGEIKYVDPNWKSLGSIKNKKVFMKIIYYPVEKNGKTGTRLEWWFDKKALETGKLENDWQHMAYAEDFGDWGDKFGAPHLENNGVKYKGKVLGFYIRIDTPTKPVEFSHQGQHELDLPQRKL